MFSGKFNVFKRLIVTEMFESSQQRGLPCLILADQCHQLPLDIQRRLILESSIALEAKPNQPHDMLGSGITALPLLIFPYNGRQPKCNWLDPFNGHRAKK